MLPNHPIFSALLQRGTEEKVRGEKNVHILGLIAENYKRLRVVEIHPKGNVVQITGRNGQGKTSVLDAIWTALAGRRATPEKPVRKGAEKCRLKVNLGELIVTRTITANGTQTLIVETDKGAKVSSPQTVLDELLGSLSFDPLEFINMKPAEQIETLRRVAKITVDLDALAAENEKDYQARHQTNLDVKRLETEMAAISVQDNLPAQKIDEQKILAQITAADEKNNKARQLDDARATLQRERDSLGTAEKRVRGELEGLQKQLAMIEQRTVEGDSRLQEGAGRRVCASGSAIGRATAGADHQPRDRQARAAPGAGKAGEGEARRIGTLHARDGPAHHEAHRGSGSREDARRRLGIRRKPRPIQRDPN
jgi:predicted ATP-dependent endonuclease of OLD family